MKKAIYISYWKSLSERKLSKKGLQEIKLTEEEKSRGRREGTQLPLPARSQISLSILKATMKLSC
jgi:hypothetical protein